MDQHGTSGTPLPETARDAHRVTSELTEMLAVLVVPAMLLSGVNLFFG